MADGATAGTKFEGNAAATGAGVSGRTGRRGLRPVLAASVFAVFAFAASAAAGQSACPDQQELTAIKARVLQTDLMVAALSCGEQRRYNAFARKYYDELIDNSRVLRRYFLREHPKNGDRYLDRFVTRLANAASKRSIAHGPAYCADIGRQFNYVLTPTAVQLGEVTPQLLPPAVISTLPPCTDRFVQR